MKKYFSVLLGILLLGGAVTAQADTLENVGFMVDGVNPLPQNGADAYVLITGGDSTTEYNIGFDSKTSSKEHSLEIGLCLTKVDGTSAEELETYYRDREPPQDYLNYLISAAKGEKPFAMVIIGESSEVKLCDGAVYNVTLEHDCVPMRIPGDYPCAKYTVSDCDSVDSTLTFDLIICTDSDDDNITDYEDKCPNTDISGDLGGTAVIDGCDTGVDNILFDDGCTISDLIMNCADAAGNHGDFVSCVSHITNELKPQVLSGAEKGAIQSCAAQSGTDASGQNRHRARYELAENDLVIPCVEIGKGQYFGVDMDLTSATSNNFHFKVKKAEAMTQTEINGIVDPEGTCAHYDLLSNSLLFPRLEIGEKQWRVQMKLLGTNSVNLHFKLEGITEAQ
jgi:hypothetical protein